MKTNTWIALGILAVLTLSTTSCVDKVVKASNNFIKKEIHTSNFQNIQLYGSIDATYVQGAQSGVEIYGPDNIVPLIETDIDNGSLTIKYKDHITILDAKKVEVKVISNDLSVINIFGSGDISLPNGIKQTNGLELSVSGSGNISGKGIQVKKLSVNIQGSGNASLQDIKSERYSVEVLGSGDAFLRDIRSEKCSARILGSGNIDLSGVTGNANFEIAGSGDINAAKLQTVNVKASTFGSGNISCYTTGILAGNTAGSGNIIYKGNPKKIDFPSNKLHKID